MFVTVVFPYICSMWICWTIFLLYPQSEVPYYRRCFFTCHQVDAPNLFQNSFIVDLEQCFESAQRRLRKICCSDYFTQRFYLREGTEQRFVFSQFSRNFRSMDFFRVEFGMKGSLYPMVKSPSAMCSMWAGQLHRRFLSRILSDCVRASSAILRPVILEASWKLCFLTVIAHLMHTLLDALPHLMHTKSENQLDSCVK